MEVRIVLKGIGQCLFIDCGPCSLVQMGIRLDREGKSASRFPLGVKMTYFSRDGFGVLWFLRVKLVVVLGVGAQVF